MAIGNKVTDEVRGFGILVLVIVILSVVLLKMRDNSSVVCNNNQVLNTISEVCCTNLNCSVNATARTLRTDLTTYVTAFQEPRNWIVIIIIAVIGIYLMKKFAGKKAMG